MTLEERVEKLEGDFQLSNTPSIHQSRGTLEYIGATEKLTERITKLEEQVNDLDVMVLSIKGMLEETLEILKQ